MHRMREDVTAEGCIDDGPVTPLPCSNQIQTDPVGNGQEPSGGCILTGPEIRAGGVVLNKSLCNEMRAVSEYRNVRVMRQLELLFCSERGDVRRARSMPPASELQAHSGERPRCETLYVYLTALSTPCAWSVRCGAGAWRGVLRLPLADREAGESTEVPVATWDRF